MNEELAYWIALAHAPKLKTKTKNEIIVKQYEKGESIVDFFKSDAEKWPQEYGLSQTEHESLTQAAGEIPNYAFLVEELLDQGYNILPITSPDYSPTLKKNLGKQYAPPVIYTKGNLQILKEASIAIVGSRKAGERSLTFTDTIAQKASKEYKVVVSGFAKGVDKQALDSVLKYKGQSIIVLPQGISTFASGYKKYYKQITEGDVLVLSTFHPKAPWSVQLAMGRNPIIYGLASEIYVAESADKGGTWSGVVDGLRKKRKIYVRIPTTKEKNANALLIEKGAVAVDEEGTPTSFDVETGTRNRVSEPENDSMKTEDRILNLLKTGSFSSQAILEKLHLDWTPGKITSFLKKHPKVETLSTKPLEFRRKEEKGNQQISMF
jgi:predicted Rossmann fold nucleotide-binding protein DprA/Smf involved in DNA uptake